MQFNVAQLIQSPIGIIRDFEIDEDPQLETSLLSESDDGINDELRALGVCSKITGNARLIRTKRGILVDARLGTELSLECSRCLEELRYPIKIQFSEEFLTKLDTATGLPLSKKPGDEESQAFQIDENHLLDLSEPLRQYTILATPGHPLCSEDCKGLCPNCGANLNIGACACAPEAPTGQFARLTALLEKSDPDSSKSQKDN